MASDREEVDEQLRIDHGTMQEFIATFPNLTTVLTDWFMLRAQEKDIKSLNHFMKFAYIHLEEACRRIKQEAVSEGLKNWSVPFDGSC